jgi:hypothetical protein
MRTLVLSLAVLAIAPGSGGAAPASVTIAGSLQSEVGCLGDWQPDCLRSWLEDVDGDGVYTFETTALPAGTYETKATIGEDWTENYGAGGVPNGATIAFVVPASGVPIRSRFDGQTKVLTVPEPGPPRGLRGRAPGPPRGARPRYAARALTPESTSSEGAPR